MARQRLRERGVNRAAVLVYGGGAVLLAPWIVVLALSQKQSTDGYHLRLSSPGMSAFIVAGLVRTAITCRRQYPGVVVPASLAATFPLHLRLVQYDHGEAWSAGDRARL